MGSAPFVGREREVAAIRAAAQGARRGRGRAVVIEGEAGIGKTRLLQESLRGRGARVIRGAARELGGSWPFGVIVDALGIDLRAAQVGRLLLSATKGKRGSGPGNVEFRVSEALLAHVDDLCADGTLTLVLEDLHWTDPSTLVFLDRLGRRLSRLRLLVVVTRRPLPESLTLDRVIERLTERSARRLRLGPLTGEDVAAMARTVLGGEPGPRLLAHLAGAAGNPGLVSELLHAAREHGDLVAGAGPPGEVDLRAGAAPGRLSLLVLHRMSLLPADTLDLLRLAALFGADFSVAELCQVLAVPALALGHRLRPALVARVLEEAGERFRFRHGAIRDALYGDIPQPLQSQLHLEVAQALAEAHAAPEQVAQHLLRGASAETATPVPALRATSARLAGRAPGLAADLLARAAELAPHPAERDGLLAERAQALWRAGRLTEAEAVCRSLLTGRPDPWVHLCLTQVVMAQGRLGEAMTVIEEGLATGEESGVVRARFLAWAAWAGLYSENLAGAEDLAAQAQLAAKEAGDRFAQMVALATRAAVANLRGRVGEAIELAGQALWLEAEPGDEPEHFPLHLLLAAFLFDAGRLEEGHAAVARALAACHDRGSRWALPCCHWLAALGSFLSGRWDAALVELEAAAALAEELGTRPLMVYGHAICAFIGLHRGDVPAARRALAAAEADTEVLGRQYRLHWALWAGALVAEASGSRERAFALLGDAWSACARAGAVSEFPVLGPDFIRLALATGARAAAEAATAAVEEAAAQARTEVVEVALLRCRGLVADDPRLLAEAARRAQRGGRPLPAAQASEEAGAALARRGEAEEARAMLDEALRGYTGLGATYDSARVEARLRHLGVRRGRQGARRRPRHGWASLTETERTVASLVAEGLSNRQIAERLFLSRHTVHTHVSHILAKLGLGSRVELATEALRRSTSPIRAMFSPD